MEKIDILAESIVKLEEVISFVCLVGSHCNRKLHNCLFPLNVNNTFVAIISI